MKAHKNSTGKPTGQKASPAIVVPMVVLIYAALSVGAFKAASYIMGKLDKETLPSTAQTSELSEKVISDTDIIQKINMERQKSWL